MSQHDPRPTERHLASPKSLAETPAKLPGTSTEGLLPGGARASLDTYLRSATTLRDIHSLKLSRTRRAADWLKFGLIALSTIATCVGFIGISDIASDISVSEGVVNFIFNILLLLLLLVVIWDLAWRHGDQSHEHQRAIVVLTGFIRDVENRLRQSIAEDDVQLVERFGERHELIIEVLPPHTDADYLASKKAASEKEVRKAAIRARTEERLEEIAKRSAKQQ
jgi:hypothetical protein